MTSTFLYTKLNNAMKGNKNMIKKNSIRNHLWSNNSTSDHRAKKLIRVILQRATPKNVQRLLLIGKKDFFLFSIKNCYLKICPRPKKLLKRAKNIFTFQSFQSSLHRSMFLVLINGKLHFFWGIIKGFFDTVVRFGPFGNEFHERKVMR